MNKGTDRLKLSNKDWIDFLSKQFSVSRTTARGMLHSLMMWKASDNFKKEFSGGQDNEQYFRLSIADNRRVDNVADLH